MKTLTAALFGALLLMPAAMPAQATEAGTALCGKRQQILDSLENRYAESPRAMGLAGNGSVVELLTSSDGTWTILVTRPSGMACLAAAGQHWESIAAGPAAGQGL